MIDRCFSSAYRVHKGTAWGVLGWHALGGVCLGRVVWGWAGVGLVVWFGSRTTATSGTPNVTARLRVKQKKFHACMHQIVKPVPAVTGAGGLPPPASPSPRGCAVLAPSPRGCGVSPGRGS